VRNIIFYVFCFAALGLYVLVCKFLVYGVSQEFGWGVGVGFGLALALAYFAELAGLKEPRY
jgi:hypothetical protein